MFEHLAKATSVIVGLFLMWTAVQALKRRSDPRYKRGDDVLAGCGTCSIADACHGATDGTETCSTGARAGKE